MGETSGVSAATGFSQTEKVLPIPGELSTVMLPPMASSTLRVIESPMPVPDPMALVVKKGSKIRSRISGLIPHPVSETSSKIR